MNPNPLPQIQLSSDGASWGAPGAEVSVSANGTFYARLATTQGVDSTTWAILTTDETGTAATVNAGTGIGQSQTTGTAAGTGSCLILQAQINGGLDGTTNSYNPETTTCTAKVWVPAANGYQVIAYDEHGESGAFWWVPLVNRAIRNSAGGGTADVNPTANTLALRDGSGQLRATSFATASSGMPTGGVLRTPATDEVVIAKAGNVAANVPLFSQANGGQEIQLGDGNEIVDVNFLGAYLINLGTEISFGSAVAPSIVQAPISGTGSANGQTLTMQAQGGQNETGSANNTNGGNLVLAAGNAGAGGSGTPGVPGQVFVNGAAVQVPYTAALADPGSGNNAILIVAQPSGNGSRNGQAFQIFGQPGQDVPAGMSLTNNDGGDLVLSAGPAGSGGTGGNAGRVLVDGFEFHLNQGGGGTDILAVTSTGLNVANSAGKLGFFGTTPIVQPNRVGQLVDGTGGTPSSGLAAIVAGSSYAQSDMVAVQNALASLAAKQNAVEALLSAAASGFGLTK